MTQQDIEYIKQTLQYSLDNCKEEDIEHLYSAVNNSLNLLDSLEDNKQHSN